MTRRETLEFLLWNYRDVEYGLQHADSRSTDEFVPQMCRAWRHPSYVELRRCIEELARTHPFIYWDFREFYFRYEERRVSYCPRCLKEAAPGLTGSEHKHGQKSITLLPKVVRRHSFAIRPEHVRAGVLYVDRNFKGEPFIPDDLLAQAA